MRTTSTASPRSAFTDWDANQRYFHRTDIDAQAIERHKMGAQETRLLLERAVLDGLVA
jgi:hypothetical protein